MSRLSQSTIGTLQVHVRTFFLTGLDFAIGPPPLGSTTCVTQPQGLWTSPSSGDVTGSPPEVLLDKLRFHL